MRAPQIKSSQRPLHEKKLFERISFFALFLKISLFSLAFRLEKPHQRFSQQNESDARAAFAKHPLNSPSALLTVLRIIVIAHTARAHTHTSLSHLSLLYYKSRV